MLCATCALGISWQHLNHLNMLLRSVYFHLQIILHRLGITCQYEDGFSKVKYVREYVYLVLTCHVQAKWSIEGNLVSTVNAHQVCKATFNVLINKNHSITFDIDRCQRILQDSLSKVDFSIDTVNYLLTNNLNLNCSIQQ